MAQRSNPALSKPASGRSLSKAALLIGTRAQRIPSWPGAETPTKAEYICADQPATLTFHLRKDGGPYISGLPQRADHELVVEALCGLLGREYAELRLKTE